MSAATASVSSADNETIRLDFFCIDGSEWSGIDTSPLKASMQEQALRHRKIKRTKGAGGFKLAGGDFWEAQLRNGVRQRVYRATLAIITTALCVTDDTGDLYSFFRAQADELQSGPHAGGVADDPDQGKRLLRQAEINFDRIADL